MQAQVRNLAELAAAARERLDPAIWDFLEGGAGEERSVGANRAAFSAWNFRPRILAGNGPADLRSRFLGLDLDFPVMTAPFGADGLFDAGGQIAVAEAAAAVGVASMAPHVSTFTLEAIRDAAPGAAHVFQLHPVGSEDNFLRLAERAAAAGYRALCITADCPTAGYRDRVLARQFVYEDVMGGNYDASGPWTSDEMFGQFRTMTEPVWTFEQLGRLLEQVGLPFFIKGVMTGDDARRSADIGAAGVLVSNHGGRQLDCAPGTLEQLPEIVDAVGAEIDVALDGGIRRGTDVVKALALGADAVVVGRLAAMGLGAGGADGVRRALEMVREEMVKTLELIGCEDVASLDPSFLQPSASAGR